jgi:hypothetical protein
MDTGLFTKKKKKKKKKKRKEKKKIVLPSYFGYDIENNLRALFLQHQSLPPHLTTQNQSIPNPKTYTNDNTITTFILYKP